MAANQVATGYNVEEARKLLRDYRAALPLCRNGALLKEEFAKLNLRAFDLGLVLTPETPLALKFQEVVGRTSDRRSQGGIYAHMDEAANIERWIEFLTLMANPAPELQVPTLYGKLAKL